MTRPFAKWVLVAVTIVGLAIDAYVHLDIAASYDMNATTTMSQGDLFRLEAILAIVSGVALLVRQRWWTAVPAALVAGGGAILLVVYRYVDIGEFGPIPSMYEPTWSSDGKVLTLVAQIVAALAALALLPALSRAKNPRPAPVPA